MRVDQMLQPMYRVYALNWKCVFLRGGSEAYNSNKILSKLFRKSLKSFKVNENFVQFSKY